MDSRTGRFVVVTGVGHAATKWLTMVLHRPDEGVVFYHEPLMRQTKGKHRWSAARQMELGTLPCPSVYRNFIKEELKSHRIVGDAMSWAPLATLTVLPEWFDVDLVIYLVRHGIPQLHSIFTKSLWNWYTERDFLYAEYLRRYWELAGGPYKDWSEWTVWEMLCLWWNSNAFMPPLTSRVGWMPADVHCMENLTQDAKYLSFFCRTFGLDIPPSELKLLQSQDINRKVEGNRTPKHLWNLWSPSQQEAFLRICGPGMEELGYELP